MEAPAHHAPKTGSVNNIQYNGVNGASNNYQSQQQQQKDISKMSFDELLKNPQISSSSSAQQQQQQPSNWGMYGQSQLQNHFGNYGMTQQQNQYCFMSQQQSLYPQQQQSYINQFAHNPYIGYAPHNNLHAAYNILPQSVPPSYSGFTFN